VGRGLAALLDARPRAAFLAGHAPGAAHLPLAEWDRRAAELPARDLAFDVVGEDPGGAARCAALLASRGFPGARAAEPAIQDDRCEIGPARAVLWRASEALERHRARIPGRGRALDVACGSGRSAAWLAARGLEAWGIDLLPDALTRARALERGVRELHEDAPMFPRAPLAFARADATRGLPFRACAFDLVCGFRYLDRALFPRVAELLVPGGLLLWETFSARAPRDTRPRRAAFRLASGELGALCRAAGLEVEVAEGDGALDVVLARRP
jgi:SAM-dependent methyltransferase